MTDFIFKAEVSGDQKSITMNGMPWAQMFGRDDGEELGEYAAYQAIAWVRRCLDIRANALSAIPAVVTRGEEVVEEWEYADRLPELLWQAEASLSMYGASYWIRQRNAYGFEKWLRWLLPTTMKLLTNKREGLVGFERTVDGLSDTYPADVGGDIVWMFLPTLNAEVGYGPGWVTTALLPANMLNAVNVYGNEFFKRGAIPATILTVDGHPPAAELDRLKTWWERAFSGKTKAFGTAAVSAKVEPKIVSYPTKDLAMEELSLLVRRQVATAAGVPHTMLEDAANYATAAEHRVSFYTETVIPEAMRIENALNQHIFDPLGLRLVLDWQSMDIFQKDEAERADSLKKLTEAGIPLDMAMQILGFDLPEGMTYEDVAARLEEDRERNMAIAASIGDGSDDEEDDSKAIREELDRWRRKSLSALKAGESPDVAFDTSLVGDDDQAALHKALGAAEDAEEVKSAFEWPFRQSTTYP